MVTRRIKQCIIEADKAGRSSSPGPVCKDNTKAVERVHFPADQVNMSTPRTSLENRLLSTKSDVTVPQLTPASEVDCNQVEEYESESDLSYTNSADLDLEEMVTGKSVITRSGRHVKA